MTITVGCLFSTALSFWIIITALVLVLTMNQGTFLDYHYEDGTAGPSYHAVEYLAGEYWQHDTICGIFECASNVCFRGPDSYVLYAAYAGSRLSWFSTLTTCKIIIIIMLQLLRPRIDWLMSMVAILIRIL